MSDSRAYGVVRGASVVELLVALALFAVTVVGALAHYQAVRRAQAEGESLAALQQAVRAAYDRVASDVGTAGFGVDPDADASRPDESIEGAFAHAIIVRADFDGATAEAHDPETLLGQAGAFENVSTGNDEIVGYLLGKADGSDADALAFDADVVGVPRDGIVERISIGAVSLAADDPPYTLYRVSIRPDSTTATRAPVVDDVRAVRFTYLDAVGRPIAPPGGLDDADARRARGEIRRVRVEVEGVSGDADPRWVDRADAHPATRHRRKFRLTGQVAPPNLGAHGPSAE